MSASARSAIGVACAYLPAREQLDDLPTKGVEFVALRLRSPHVDYDREKSNDADIA